MPKTNKSEAKVMIFHWTTWRLSDFSSADTLCLQTRQLTFS